MVERIPNINFHIMYLDSSGGSSPPLTMDRFGEPDSTARQDGDVE